MTYTRAELLEMAAAEGIVMGVAQTVDEVLASEQYAYRGLWAEIGSSGEAGARSRSPATCSRDSPTDISGRGPSLSDAAGARRWLPAAPEPIVTAHGERTAQGAGGAAGARLRLELGRPDGRSAAGRHGRRGDPHRDHQAPGPDALPRLHVLFFCHNNRSKMSATVNVATAEGSRLVRELARTADIVMDNFAAGVMAKNGLGYDELLAANPGWSWCR